MEEINTSKSLTCEHCGCKTNQLTDNLCPYCYKRVSPDKAIIPKKYLEAYFENIQLKQDKDSLLEENKKLKKQLKSLYGNHKVIVDKSNNRYKAIKVLEEKLPNNDSLIKYLEEKILENQKMLLKIVDDKSKDTITEKLKNHGLVVISIENDLCREILDYVNKIKGVK
jgi:hypothetical protein